MTQIRPLKMQHNVQRITPVRTQLASITTAIFALLSTQPAVAQNATPLGEFAKGRLIVMQRAGLPAVEMDKALKPFGASAKRLGRSDLHVVQLPPGMSETAVSAALARNPAFKFAELDRRFSLASTPNDPLFPQAWHLTKIGAPSAWDSTQGSGVIIAVLDTGMDASHPDIASQAVAGWNFADNNSNTADSTAMARPWPALPPPP
jgi:thermitase